MQRSDGLAWALVLAVALVDAIWLGRANFAIDGFGLGVAGIVALLAIAVGYGATGRSPRLAGLAQWCALYMAASGALAVLSYLAASLALPLRDSELTQFDHALGFDWLSVATWIGRHEWLVYVLTFAYTTFLPQIVGTVVYFALRGDESANRELVWTLLLGAMVTVAIFGVAPANCSPDLYGATSPDFAKALAYRFEACGGGDLTLLRSGVPHLFHFTNMEGIIALPSFHTVVAVLLIYAHRRQRWLLGCSLALNGVMLLSVPPVGGHYLSDLLAGAAVAGVLILAVEWRRAGVPAPALAAATRGAEG